MASAAAADGGGDSGGGGGGAGSGAGTYTIRGCRVNFPFKPYPSQLAFMDKLILAVDSKSNGLLESPTGSGKTLSLLCGLLAWQAKIKAEYASLDQADIAREVQQTAAGGTDGKTSLVFTSKVQKKPKRRKVPRIFYCSRTHSQLAQITDELRSTSYRPSMSILASRKHTCIHPTASKAQPNPNEACKQLLEYSQCKQYRQHTKLKTTSDLQAGGAHAIWDLEDLVAIGKRESACPYFGARALAEDAEIVFAPYDYVINPVVRSAMEISLKDAVLVIDEGHNAEDVGRSVASADYDINVMKIALAELNRVIAAGAHTDIHNPVRRFVSTVFDWFSSAIPTLEAQGFEREGRVLTGQEAATIFEQLDLRPTSLAAIRTAINEMAALSTDTGNRKRDEIHVNSVCQSLCESLIQSFDFFYGNNRKNSAEYRLIIKKEKAVPADSDGSSRAWRNADWTHKLCFLCLNPAVAFAPLGDQVRSLILTSGTLAPLDSFASELGLPFPIRLEAPHVIDKNQVWVGHWSKAPLPGSGGGGGSGGGSGGGGAETVLNASYKTATDLKFQDSLGETFLRICEIVPAGLLAFFPSYSLMTNVTARWQATGLFSKLEKLKLVLIEPKSQRALEKMRKRFVDAVDPAKVSRKNHTHNGALFIGVCRGKLAEGIDFADHLARGIIVVGVPFPNAVAQEIKLKKDHNTATRKTNPSLLDGDAWYRLQAYRAINQAVGRVIRHRWDYGAIMLLDERFNQSALQNSLSKWVKASMQHRTGLADVTSSLGQFFAKWTANPPGPAKQASVSPRKEPRSNTAKAAAATGDPNATEWITKTRKSREPQQITIEEDDFDIKTEVTSFYHIPQPPAVPSAAAAAAASGTDEVEEPEVIDIEDSAPEPDMEEDAVMEAADEKQRVTASFVAPRLANTLTSAAAAVSAPRPPAPAPTLGVSRRRNLAPSFVAPAAPPPPPAPPAPVPSQPIPTKLQANRQRPIIELPVQPLVPSAAATAAAVVVSPFSTPATQAPPVTTRFGCRVCNTTVYVNSRDYINLPCTDCRYVSHLVQQSAVQQSAVSTKPEMRVFRWALVDDCPAVPLTVGKGVLSGWVPDATDQPGRVLVTYHDTTEQVTMNPLVCPSCKHCVGVRVIASAREKDIRIGDLLVPYALVCDQSNEQPQPSVAAPPPSQIPALEVPASQPVSHPPTSFDQLRAPFTPALELSAPTLTPVLVAPPPIPSLFATSLASANQANAPAIAKPEPTTTDVKSSQSVPGSGSQAHATTINVSTDVHGRTTTTVVVQSQSQRSDDAPPQSAAALKPPDSAKKKRKAAIRKAPNLVSRHPKPVVPTRPLIEPEDDDMGAATPTTAPPAAPAAPAPVAVTPTSSDADKENRLAAAAGADVTQTKPLPKSKSKPAAAKPLKASKPPTPTKPKQKTGKKSTPLKSKPTADHTLRASAVIDDDDSDDFEAPPKRVKS